MMSLNPLLLVGDVIGTVSVLLLIAYACVKDKKTAMASSAAWPTARSCAASSATPSPISGSSSSWASLVLFSISYDIASAPHRGLYRGACGGRFRTEKLYVSVAVYAGVLVFSMASTYLQAVILQRVGQRIISDLREDFLPTLKASPTAS